MVMLERFTGVESKGERDSGMWSIGRVNNFPWHTA